MCWKCSRKVRLLVAGELGQEKKPLILAILRYATSCTSSAPADSLVHFPPLFHQVLLRNIAITKNTPRVLIQFAAPNPSVIHRSVLPPFHIVFIPTFPQPATPDFDVSKPVSTSPLFRLPKPLNHTHIFHTQIRLILHRCLLLLRHPDCLFKPDSRLLERHAHAASSIPRRALIRL